MDGRLRVTKVPKLLFDLLCAGLLAAAVGHAHGEGAGAAASSGAPGLADPTRPPMALAEGEPKDEAKPSEPPPAGLQTVILRKGAKPLAIINGQTVELGGTVGDARLVSLSETEAVLQGPNGKEVMRMIPAVERKAVLPPEPQEDAKAAAKSGVRKKTKTKLTK